MGGNALNRFGITTERKNTEDFNRIANEIQSQLACDFNGINTEVIKCYRNKPTHGDLDLLLKIDNNFRNLNVGVYIDDTFQPKGIYHNSNAYSFDYENFQIDFILIKDCDWESALTYYSYDPVGNAMGKTFHKFNLSYGWDGLKYRYRNFNGRNSHNIVISKNPKKIFEFGGYDYDKFLSGFDTIEEIFEFVVNSKYFNFDIFKFENLKHIDRKRNRKRKSYNHFINYVDSLESVNSYVFNKNKVEYLKLINESFPEANIYEKIAALEVENEKNIRLNEKLNGRIIMKLIPNLTGKSLGLFIDGFKKSFNGEYENIILKMSEDEVNEKILSFYKEK